MSQWILAENLRLLGFAVKSIISKTSQTARDAILKDFNDPKAEVDILVTNYRTTSLSVNLHKACAELNIATSVNAAMQAIDRARGVRKMNNTFIFFDSGLSEFRD